HCRQAEDDRRVIAMRLENLRRVPYAVGRVDCKLGGHRVPRQNKRSQCCFEANADVLLSGGGLFSSCNRLPIRPPARLGRRPCPPPEATSASGHASVAEVPEPAPQGLGAGV